MSPFHAEAASEVGSSKLLTDKPGVRVVVQHAVNDSQPKSVKGTIAYLAPEVVLCNFNKAKCASTRSLAARCCSHCHSICHLSTFIPIIWIMFSMVT
jgi:hypothetical protein